MKRLRRLRDAAAEAVVGALLFNAGFAFAASCAGFLIVGAMVAHASDTYARIKTALDGEDTER